MKNILFISLNGHQRRYFSALGDRLKDFYHIHHVHYAVSDLSGLVIDKQIPKGIDFSEHEIEDIIRFLLIKAQYRHFGLIRRIMHSRIILKRQALSAISYFYQYITKNNIDLVCVWNGTLVPLGAATRVAQKLGCKTLFFENGYLPNTTTVDPIGVNNNNSLVGKPAAFFEKVLIDPLKLEKLYQKPPAIRSLKSRWYHNLIRRKPAGSPESIDLTKRYIFVPFQVHDDTQVLLHSPCIKTMSKLVDYVVAAVDKHNAITGDALQIIIKEHPSDFGRVDYTELIAKYCQPNVRFLKHYPTPELIKHAQGVLTINSSVGIESLLSHKPVITLGNAFYNVPGVVEHVNNLDDLSDYLGFIDQPVNKKLIDQFLYYLRYEYLAEGAWRNPASEHFKSVLDKVTAILK